MSKEGVIIFLALVKRNLLLVFKGKSNCDKRLLFFSTSKLNCSWRVQEQQNCKFTVGKDYDLLTIVAVHYIMQFFSLIVTVDIAT